jgi:hypothetical protein
MINNIFIFPYNKQELLYMSENIQHSYGGYYGKKYRKDWKRERAKRKRRT